MISKPLPTEYPTYYNTYISKVKGEDLLQELFDQHIETIELITSLDEETLTYRYAEGKWTIKQIMVHLIDSERVFAYRAMCFSRGETTPLPGFDENVYVSNSNADYRTIHDIVQEFSTVRAASIQLFRNLSANMYDHTGIANGKEISVRALAYIILGHEIHHRGVIEERYIGN